MDFIQGLSAGQAAGIIAAGIFTARVLQRFIWPVIIIGFVRSSESAATWSVVAGELQASYWPTILRTDSASHRGVRSGVVWSARFATISSILLSIAAVLTPLGLYTVIAPEDEPREVAFMYLKDDSVFGSATPPRLAQPFNRICRDALACPDLDNPTEFSVYSKDNATDSRTNAFTKGNFTYDPAIPSEVISFFQSGSETLPHSVSSIFDIQWRKYALFAAQDIDKGRPYHGGDYGTFASTLVNDGYQLIEGLILDLVHGGVGFRNHTVPVTPQQGAVWTEDILFVQPETRCVNTNLSLEFAMRSAVVYKSTITAPNLFLVDNGGFSQLNLTIPVYPSFELQKNPLLDFRAYSGAWINNVYEAYFWNITNPGPEISGMPRFSYMNSTLGQHFPVATERYGDDSIISYPILTIGELGYYLDRTSFSFLNGTPFHNTSQNVWRNPWQISSQNWSDLRPFCYAPYNLSNQLSYATSVYGNCGLVKGIAQPLSSGASTLYEPGSKWTVPLYSCASSARAIIKTVAFRYNGTEFKDLHVENITEKTYETEADYPIWAVENTTVLTISRAPPLWGLVAETKYKAYVNMTYIRRPHLWLSAASPWPQSPSAVNFVQNLPGVDFFASAFGPAYDVSKFGGSGSGGYSGTTSLPMTQRWTNYSSSVTTTPNIINRIWTDVVANAVVGTKGWHTSSYSAKNGLQKRAESDADPLVSVTLYTRRLRYHMVYAIPAIIMISILIVTSLASLVLALTRRASPARIRHHLNRTGAGRLLYQLATGDGSFNNASSKMWARRVGSTQIELSDVTSDATAMEASGRVNAVNRHGAPGERPLLDKDNTDVQVEETDAHSSQVDADQHEDRLKTL